MKKYIGGKRIPQNKYVFNPKNPSKPRTPAPINFWAEWYKSITEEKQNEETKRDR
jgi:hypothetical protein